MSRLNEISAELYEGNEEQKRAIPKSFQVVPINIS